MQTEYVSKSLVATLRYDNKYICIYACTCIHTVYTHILPPAFTLNKSELSTERTYILCTILNSHKQQYPYTVSFPNEHALFM
jgi:hypothetical protein